MAAAKPVIVPFGKDHPLAGTPVYDKNGKPTGGKHKHDDVAIYIPENFDPKKPVEIVVSFHGHKASLEGDVIQRQKMAEQAEELAGQGRNIIFVAPQMAYKMANSNAGRLNEAGAVNRFLGRISAEAAKEYNRTHDDKTGREVFDKAALTVAGYSGGGHAVAEMVSHPAVRQRLDKIILADALYSSGDTKKIAAAMKNSHARLDSSYITTTRASTKQNAYLETLLDGPAAGRARIHEVKNEETNHSSLYQHKVAGLAGRIAAMDASSKTLVTAPPVKIKPAAPRPVPVV
jgi:hypothetical protein